MGSHAYTASKHAVAELAKSVAAELGRHGVRVNCVSPYAAVPTALSMPHLPKGARADDPLKGFLAFVGGEANLKGVDLMPKDIAEAVLYLASDEARYICQRAQPGGGWWLHIREAVRGLAQVGSPLSLLFCSDSMRQ